MSLLLTKGTQLEPDHSNAPLNRPFFIALSFLFIIAMHLFQPNPGGAGLSLAFNAASWIPFSFAVAIGFYHTAKQGILRYTKFTAGLFIVCITLTVPLFFNDALPSIALPRLIALWAGFIFFVILQQFTFANRQKQQLLWLVVLAVCIESLFGYAQFLLLEPNNIFGYNTITNRPYGIFQQPNVMASFLATGLALACYLLARQPIKYDRHPLSLVLLLLTIVLTIPLIVVLASRTGWLSAILVLVMIAPYMWRFTNKRRFFLWIVALLVSLCLSIALVQYSQHKTNGNGLAEQTLIHKSNLQSARAYIFPQALDMFLEKPLTGYGYGRFESQYTLYTAKQHSLNANYHPGLPSLSHPHNELLFWAVEGGIIPILGLLLAVALIVNRILKTQRYTRLAILALFMPISIHTQLEYPFYHSVPHWITFILLLFWVDQLSCKRKKINITQPTKVSLRLLSLIIPITVSYYMLSVIHTNDVLTRFETTRPIQPDILFEVSNSNAWQDRYNWNIYSTQLKLGIQQNKPELIQSYIDWSEELIKSKPRPAFYKNLIIAYEGLKQLKQAEDIRAEASYLFPVEDFSDVHLNKTPPPESK
ncbi:MAG: PglL family O-oligosaccharyltransferase [Aliivibrio sp.]|uniref:PglL family O-oligosaccharyltransferase n=1 Tax=Aliivibrio sp. TaxID=1872443 RepID=UPI001A3B0AA3|nr:PglL family O-oligosaccharyltransferase [Aliivibrio sp.]